jgi:hypothetical protein
LLDLIELDIVDTNPSAQFRQNLINEFGEGSFELLRIEQDFNPQFSSIIRYIFAARIPTSLNEIMDISVNIRWHWPEISLML